MQVIKKRDFSWLFWSMIRLIGIEANKSDVSKYRLLIIVCLVLAGACLYFTTVLQSHVNLLLLASTSTIQISASVLIAVTFYRKRHILNEIRCTIRRPPNQPQNIFCYSVIYVTLAITLTDTFGMPLTVHFTAKEMLNEYALNFFPENGTLRDLLCVLNASICTFLLVSVPFWVNCIFCGYCLSWSEKIRSVRDIIEKSGRVYFQQSNKYDGTAILQLCSKIWKTTKLLRESFSGILLFLALVHILSIFVMAKRVVLIGEGKPHLLKFYILQLAGYCLIFVMTVHFAVRVPKELENLSSTFKRLYRDLIFRQDAPERSILYRRIELLMKEEAIYLSVGEFVDMNYNLILTTAGGVISYGFLLVQNTSGLKM